MKTITNITSIILFIALVPVIYISYKLIDTWEALKVNIDDLPPSSSNKILKSENMTTAYPDDVPNNFNEWKNYINKQLN